jgi:cytochrome P450 family 4
LIQNYQIIERKKCERDQRAGFDEAPKKKIFLDYLLDLTNQDDRWRDEESIEEARTIVVAGSDATALSVCYVLMMLAMHQEIQVGQLKSNCTPVMTLF